MGLDKDDESDLDHSCAMIGCKILGGERIRTGSLATVRDVLAEEDGGVKT